MTQSDSPSTVSMRRGRCMRMSSVLVIIHEVSSAPWQRVKGR